MEQKQTSFGTTEQEIFEELRIRNELEPIASFDEYLTIIDEVVDEKISFGEMDPNDDTQQIKDTLARRFDELNADITHTSVIEEDESPQ